MDNNDKLQRQKELVELLNKASLCYYSGKSSIMSDQEYDQLYDELERTEAETGIILDESPTQRVGFEPVSKLKKLNHEAPALSLAKTQDISKLKNWIITNAEPSPSKEVVISWKCDGLTLVVTYENGKLTKAVTRGDGFVGEDVTHNAPFIKGLPQTIPFTDKLIVRGEVVTSYADFEAIKAVFPDADDAYATPRNLTSGSLRQLNPKVAAVRKMQFKAFEYVIGRNLSKVSDTFEELAKFGFAVVEYRVLTKETFDEVFNYFKNAVKTNDIPTDGLVLILNDIHYSKLLGTTKKTPKNAMAFKWEDATEDTTLRSIEWSASMTGRINPVAIFDPVDLDGTTVSRASVHNISVMKQQKLAIGAIISVFKANMIIPQIRHCDSNEFNIYIPDKCPVCQAKTVQKVTDTLSGAVSLICPNPNCYAKMIGHMERFVSREGLNIQGISIAMLKALVDNHIIRTPVDIMYISQLLNGESRISKLDGFGVKTYKNIVDAVNAAKHTTFKQFICCFGIEDVGEGFASCIRQHFSTPDNNGKKLSECLEKLMLNSIPDSISNLVAVKGIGEKTAKNFVEWYINHKDDYDDVKDIVTITDDKIVVKQTNSVNNIAGKTFVITGSLNHYVNRSQLTNEIILHGGKVAGSVSNKTDYLINNDIESTSGKNKTAKELGVSIISEDDYIKMLPKN